MPTTVSGESMPKQIAKFDWVKRDLRSVLETMPPTTRFEVMAFKKGVKAFAGAFSPASPSVVKRAVSFLSLTGTASERGTNLHAGLASAFRLKDLGMVSLFTDGHPSLGPGIDEIDRDVFMWNYLRGARVTVVSFAGDVTSPDNLCFRLARRNFGWVRLLNPEPDAAATALPTVKAPGDSDWDE